MQQAIPPGDERSAARNMLRRTAVARALGVTVSMVRKWELSGELPVYMVENEHCFSPRDVEYLRIKRAKKSGLKNVHTDGELAAEIFAVLASGISVIECVQRFRVHPDVVEHCAGQYARMSGTVYLSAQQLSELQQVVGATSRATTAVELLAQATKAMASAHPCMRCADATAKFCSECLTTELRAELQRAARAPQRAPRPPARAVRTAPAPMPQPPPPWGADGEG